MAETWNLHRIRPCNGDTPPGKPDFLFFVPHEAGGRDYKANVCKNDLVIAENNYVRQHISSSWLLSVICSPRRTDNGR